MERRVKSAKMDPRADVGILVGYEGESIYQCWIPSRALNKLVRSSHVRFDEGGFKSIAALSPGPSTSTDSGPNSGPGISPGSDIAPATMPSLGISDSKVPDNMILEDTIIVDTLYLEPYTRRPRPNISNKLDS